MRTMWLDDKVVRAYSGWNIETMLEWYFRLAVSEGLDRF